ncbi:hypothetical protein Thermo_01683 [Thermoplasmatales archaeon]|nr:hypothetical protein Thermo_01683 [Thermoplasmatales archaeon]
MEYFVSGEEPAETQNTGHIPANHDIYAIFRQECGPSRWSCPGLFISSDEAAAYLKEITGKEPDADSCVVEDDEVDERVFYRIECTKVIGEISRQMYCLVLNLNDGRNTSIYAVSKDTSILKNIGSYWAASYEAWEKGIDNEVALLGSYCETTAGIIKAEYRGKP